MNLGFKLLLAPLLVGLGVGGTLLWVDRPSSPDADTRQTTAAQSAPPVQTEEGTLDDPAARDTESTHGAPAEAAVTPAPPTGNEVSEHDTEDNIQGEKPVDEAGRTPER